MRIISFLTAVLVTAFLYLLVFERDALRAVSQGAPLSTLVGAVLGGDPSSSEAQEPTEPNTEISEGQTGATEEQPAEADLIKVVAIRSKAQEIDSAVVLRGQTEAARQVQVRAETSGQVISEPLRKGSMINPNQILCQLDPGTRSTTLADTVARLAEAKARVPETQARLEEAQSRLEEAEFNLNAAEKLAEGGYATETRVTSAQAATRSAEASVATAKAGFETTRSRIQSAEAAVASAEKEIERLTLVAPFKGILETDTAEIGSLLQPGSLCATIIQIDPIKVVGFVPESNVQRVKIGARTATQLVSGQAVYGNVTFISRAADPLTRTFRVEIDVANPDLSIRDGQTAEILIASAGKQAHLLPQSALTLNDDGNLGLRLVGPDNVSKFMEVDLLRDTIEGVWLAGLPEEVAVIVVGQEYVNDGVEVAPTYREMTQ